jgi:predicted Zn-dependent protease
VLKTAVARDKDNPFAWMNLGTVYDRKGDEPRTALATAERAHLMGDVGTALMSSRAAMAGLPQGSSDWVRAQDLNMVSQTAWDEIRKKKKDR